MERPGASNVGARALTPNKQPLAAKLIEGGFSSAYVERTTSPRGMVHRVRVKFPSERDARRAVTRLRSFAAGEIWIAKQ